MKTKLLAAAFAALVCAEAFVGLRTIGKASDIVETGTELRLPIKQVKKLDFEKFDPTEFSPRIEQISLPYKTEIPIVEMRLQRGRKDKDFPFDIDFFGKPKVRVAVAFERGSDGIARAVSYSEKPAGGAYLDLTLESCNFVRYENSKKIPLEQPELEFKQPFSRMEFSKKQAARIAKYIGEKYGESTDKKSRRDYAVLRVKNGRAITVDIEVDGVSLKKIAAGESAK